MASPANVADLGVNLARLCFTYPEHVAGRRHGPRGYADYEAYRDWLRDELSFRCAFCLMRETWLLIEMRPFIELFIELYPSGGFARPSQSLLGKMKAGLIPNN